MSIRLRSRHEHTRALLLAARRGAGQGGRPVDPAGGGGARWPRRVVGAVRPGPGRFNDLLGQIPGIAANILSERLKRLEREGLLVARPYSERPPRAAYELTAEGKDLAGALRLLAHWGA